MSAIKKILNCLNNENIKLDHIQDINMHPTSKILFVIGNNNQIFSIDISTKSILGM